MARSQETRPVRRDGSDAECEIILRIMLDLWRRRIDGMLTREISDRYGLSMEKTNQVMHEFCLAGFEGFAGGILGYNSNDGTNGFMKHTNWFFY